MDLRINLTILRKEITMQKKLLAVALLMSLPSVLFAAQAGATPKKARRDDSARSSASSTPSEDARVEEEEAKKPGLLSTVLGGVHAEAATAAPRWRHSRSAAARDGERSEEVSASAGDADEGVVAGVMRAARKIANPPSVRFGGVPGAARSVRLEGSDDDSVREEGAGASAGDQLAVDESTSPAELVRLLQTQRGNFDAARRDLERLRAERDEAKTASNLHAARMGECLARMLASLSDKTISTIVARARAIKSEEEAARAAASSDDLTASRRDGSSRSPRSGATNV
jgi:hypothetical protein